MGAMVLTGRAAQGRAAAAESHPMISMDPTTWATNKEMEKFLITQ